VKLPELLCRDLQRLAVFAAQSYGEGREFLVGGVGLLEARLEQQHVELGNPARRDQRLDMRASSGLVVDDDYHSSRVAIEGADQVGNDAGVAGAAEVGKADLLQRPEPRVDAIRTSTTICSLSPS